MSKFLFQAGVQEGAEHGDGTSFSCSKVRLAAEVFLSEHVCVLR